MTVRYSFAVLAIAVAAGCTDGDGSYQTVTPERANQAVDAHAHGGHQHGPNGGEIIEVGDHDLHAEVVYDAAEHRITIHILGSDAATAHPIAATELTLALTHGDDLEEFKLAAAPAEGEPEGQASKFTLSSDEFMDEIAEHKEGAKLTFSVNGKDYSGTVVADPHAEHSGHAEHGEGGEHAEGGAHADEKPPAAGDDASQADASVPKSE